MTDRIRDVIDPSSRWLAGLVDEGGDHDLARHRHRWHDDAVTSLACWLAR